MQSEEAGCLLATGCSLVPGALRNGYTVGRAIRADSLSHRVGADVLVEVEVQYVEIYRNKMYDLLKGSARVLNKDKKVPACLGSRGLANAAKFCLDPEQNDSILR